MHAGAIEKQRPGLFCSSLRKIYLVFVPLLQILVWGEKPLPAARKTR